MPKLGKDICIIDGLEIPYEMAVIPIMPARIKHKLCARDEGLTFCHMERVFIHLVYHIVESSYGFP